MPHSIRKNLKEITGCGALSIVDTVRVAGISGRSTPISCIGVVSPGIRGVEWLRDALRSRGGQRGDAMAWIGSLAANKKPRALARGSCLVEVGGIEPPSEGTPCPALHA